MAKEIERKFLIVSDDWRALVTRKVEIEDGILAVHEGRKIRVRLCDQKAALTVKGPRTGVVRDEFEYEIPLQDGRDLISKHRVGEILRKTRYFVPADDGLWSIDEYHGALTGLFFAEIELATEDTKIIKPTWVGREITGRKDYSQMSLITKIRDDGRMDQRFGSDIRSD
ncbi:MULTISPECIES: CYTH domain-containing protein [unclassified Roseibium]|uniref:CYTH domain-containing protein n=1 Tax=unclassified Roseibium TaxID=2629323 RepID=UPI0027402CCC|nr:MULTISPECIES: CYTH domain-containing protein [unclassified Roseibium]